MALALALAAIFLSAAMALAFLAAEKSGKSGFIDALWSAAAGATALVVALLPSAGNPSGRQILAAALMGIWTVRLAGHIGARTLRHGDDPRYAHLKTQWGARARSRLFLFLQIQAACALVLVAAVAFAARNPRPLGLADTIVAALALGALAGAAIADRQMERFRARNPGGRAIMDEGLWAFSRHPNYFFEWLFWCAWPLIALPAPATLVALAAPALMYWLLRHASGVPHLEAHLKRTRPEAFANYAARVPVFFPRLSRQP